MVNLDAAHAEYISDPGRHENEFFAICTKKAEERLRRSVPNDAQDLAQQVVMELWRAMSKFNPAKGSFATYFSVILRSVRDRHLGGVYREAEMFDSHAEVDNAGGVADGNDRHDIEDDFSPARTKSTQVTADPNLSGVDLHKLMRLPDVDPQLVALLAAGHTLAECRRLMGTTRARIRTQVFHLKNALSHLHVAQNKH
jgi:DNA-directed RNA polymerase specialized sigma24 family protein